MRENKVTMMKRVKYLAVVAIMLVGLTIPTSAKETVSVTPYRGYTIASVTTKATGFSGYVTAWGKLIDTRRGYGDTYGSYRGYKSASKYVSKNMGSGNTGYAIMSGGVK